MKNFRPLLLQEVPVRIPGLQFRRLRLNRHLPEVELVRHHEHAFSQVLLYLSGKGLLVLRDREVVIGPGSAVFLPPHTRHAFRESSGRRPLCMVLEFDWRGAVAGGIRTTRLPQAATSEVRRLLSGISRFAEPESPDTRIASAALVLQILDLLLIHLAVIQPRRPRTPASPVASSLERYLQKNLQEHLPVGRIARDLGFSPEHLNRMIRESTGLSVREFRDAVRLEAARKLLARGTAVRDAAAAVGMLDQNYFARWFKKLTGVQPSQSAQSGEFLPPDPKIPQQQTNC